MVSKIAVIALVAIVAAPIMLGYAMNLTEVTSTEYKSSGDKLNVTETLWNSTAYSYSLADIYQVNTDMIWQNGSPSMPVYNNITTVNTSYNLTYAAYTNQHWNNLRQNVGTYPYFYEQFDYDPASNRVQIEILGMVGGVEQTIRTVDYIHSFYYNNSTNEYSYIYYVYPDANYMNGATDTAEVSAIIITTVTGYTDAYISRYDASYYADLTAGYYFTGYYYNSVKMPENTKNVLVTIDLGSITDAAYSAVFMLADQGYRLEKTTVGGVVKWTATQMVSPYKVIDLYYDPTRTDNTYQIAVDYSTTGKDASYYYYTSNIQFRYVGGWPSQFGAANTYLTIDDTMSTQSSTSGIEYYLFYVGFYDLPDNSRTPTFRIDEAKFRAFEYPAIEDKSYDPAAFKTNPITTISDPTLYGTSIEFGGNTYAVSKGNITLEGKQIPVSGLTLSSTLVNGSYENKIGNTLVSTTASPSTITFNGKWSANISTDAMEQTTVSSLEWTPGQFAWNGIDDNFLMAGLFVSFAAFVGLAIYGRSHRMSVWPLMLICGGAAALFLFML